MKPRYPSALDDFLFDVRGYLVLEQAADAQLVVDLNQGALKTQVQHFVGEMWHGKKLQPIEY